MNKRNDEMILALHKAIDLKYSLNEEKGGWQDVDSDTLLSAMLVELGELGQSVMDGNLNNALMEVADIALFGAMLCDPEREKSKIIPITKGLKEKNNG